MRVSAVVPVYNEEQNLEHMLKSLLGQRGRRVDLREVVVVASGCTDRTVEIAESVATADARVRVLVQNVRLGKASAVNAYARERDPSAEFVLIASGDILLQPGYLDLALASFEDPEVGMCGGRPVPTNDRDSLMGRIVHFMWDLHHEVSMESPKLGEAVVIRSKLMGRLSERSAVDEASFEASVIRQGFRLKYVSEAAIANRGPRGMREFLRQRRRIAAGHFWLRDTTGYSVATLDTHRVLRLALKYPTFTDPRSDAAYLAAAGLEVVARTFGLLDAKRGFNHAIWRIAPTAHEAVGPEPEADSEPGLAAAGERR